MVVPGLTTLLRGAAGKGLAEGAGVGTVELLRVGSVLLLLLPPGVAAEPVAVGGWQAAVMGGADGVGD
jgi:hypothetical protein